MATSTTRLGLTKPGYTDAVDIADINDNMDDIDAAIGASVVTSTTRPSSPYTGQIIYETDTALTLVWDGDSWEAAGGTVEIVNTDGDPGSTIYVGSVDPDGTYTLAAGDVWIEVP